jgi:hypothetical protein
MFNEIKRLHSQAITPAELLMLTTPDNVSLFDRTWILLQKTDLKQLKHALSTKNLLWLLQESQPRFES